MTTTWSSSLVGSLKREEVDLGRPGGSGRFCKLLVMFGLFWRNRFCFSFFYVDRVVLRASGDLNGLFSDYIKHLLRR